MLQLYWCCFPAHFDTNYEYTYFHRHQRVCSLFTNASSSHFYARSPGEQAKHITLYMSIIVQSVTQVHWHHCRFIFSTNDVQGRA